MMSNEVAEWSLGDEASKIVEQMRRPSRRDDRKDFLIVPGWEFEPDQKRIHAPDWGFSPRRDNEHFDLLREHESIYHGEHERGLRAFSQVFERASDHTEIAGRVLSKLANGWSLAQVSRELDIQRDEITRILHDLATWLSDAKLKFESSPPVALHPRLDWIETLEAGGLEEPDGATYQKVGNSLIDLVEVSDYPSIVEIFRRLNVGIVSTDYLVMLLRLTFAVRTNIGNWQEFLSKTRHALMARGSDADYELVGLDSDDSTE